MPKVTKNKKLSRVARRVAASDPLPMAGVVATSNSSNDPTIEATNTKNTTTNTTTHDADTPEVVMENQALSRGQRKRQAKREQYLKREKLILSTLLLQKKEEQKRRIDGLDAIRDALLETTTTTKSQPNEDLHNAVNYGTNRAKKGLVASEIQRMNLVMEHPAFQKDPFGAIQEHLRNSLAEQREKREKEAKEKALQDKVKQEQKKQEKKERLQGVKKNTKKYKPRRCR
jgi:hypothetical protein